MKLSNALEGFTYHLSSNGKSKNTIAMYKTYLTRLVEYLKDPELTDITSQDIVRFYGFMRHDYIPHRLSGDSKPLADSTIQNIWIAIRSFYNWVEQELKIPRVDGSILKPEFEYPEISPFSQEEIKALIKASEFAQITVTTNRKPFTSRRPSRLRDSAIIILLLDTGLRVSEAARLKIENVNFQKSEIYVERFSTGRKTKTHFIPIGNTTKKYVWTYLASRGEVSPHDTLFITRAGTPMDRNSIRHVLQEIGTLAKVTHVHPHRFRHTFAIEFLRNGGDIFSLQRILGHSTLDMVNTYLQLAQSDVAAAHRRASPADNIKF
jgi:integrase/recombinase XerD